MVRYLFYTIGDLTYQSPLVVQFLLSLQTQHDNVHLGTELCGSLSPIIFPASRGTKLEPRTLEYVDWKYNSADL